MQLSYSKITTLLQCPRHYELRYIEHVETLAPAYLYLGGTAHQALAEGFRLKMDGQSPSPDDLGSLFIDYWDRERFLEDEKEPREIDWQGETPADLKEVGVLLTRHYWQTVAPHIEAIDVEVPFKKGIGNITLVGRIDLITGNGRLIDWKTTKRAYSERDTVRHLQPTLYLLGIGARDFAEFDFHCLVKTKNPYVQTVTTKRSPGELRWVTEVLLPRVAKQIEAGVFVPNVSSFMCAPDTCECWYYCRGG